MLAFAGCRLRRTLRYTLGWPSRSVLLSHPGASVRATSVSELRSAEADYRRVLDHGGSVASKLRARSPFETVPVQQIVSSLKASGWEPSQWLRAQLEQRSRRIVGSQIVEHLVHHSKAAASAAPNNVISDLRSWEAPLARSVVDKIHRYSRPESSSVQLPQERGSSQRYGNVSATWDRLAGVKGPSSTTKWWSPSAANSCVPFVGALFVRYLFAAGRIDKFSLNWLGCLLRDLRGVVVRDTTGRTCEGAWLMPLAMVGDYWLVWLVVWQSLRSGSKEFQVLSFAHMHSVQFAFIVDLSDWEATGVEWLSPAAQMQRLSGHASIAEGAVVVRGFELEGSRREPLVKAAARRAFGRLPKTTLKALASHLGLGIDAGAGLFPLLRDLVAEVATRSLCVCGVCVRKSDMFRHLHGVPQMIILVGPRYYRQSSKLVSYGFLYVCSIRLCLHLGLLARQPH